MEAIRCVLLDIGEKRWIDWHVALHTVLTSHRGNGLSDLRKGDVVWVSDDSGHVEIRQTGVNL